jgi:predicted metal-binding membrane protein
MSATSLQRRRSDPPLMRGQFALVAALLGFAAVGWAVIDVRMRGMDTGPGTDLGSLGFYTTSWVVMMAAMMFPSIVPMVLGYTRVEQGMRARGRLGSTTAFVGGYLVSWVLFGLLSYGLFDAAKALSIDALRWSRDGRYLAGGVIVLAAIYQLTPAKDACLRRCRDPFTFLAEEWRDGRRGALKMGMLHGAWCVGCCWALMAALFALGLMSIGWMVFVAAIIAAEKLLRRRRIATSAVAVALLALGLGVALAPSSVPGLTVPGSAAARHAMESMQTTMPHHHDNQRRGK